MKTSTKPQLPHRKTGGFTLIEMIGVLAVIAILAALLIPKIFTAINNARVNNAAIGCSTVKAAIADHYAKFNGIPVDGSSGVPVPIPAGDGRLTAFDSVLLAEGFLEKPFLVKIGDGTTGTRIELKTGVAVTSNPATASGDGYFDLDGDGDSDTSGVVAEAVITNVNQEDAKDLNDRVDGTTLGAALGAADILGRVIFPAAANGIHSEVYVYLTHR